MSKFDKLKEAVHKGREDESMEIAKDLIAKGVNVQELLEVIGSGMRTSSEKLLNGEYSPAEVLVSIDAFRAVRDLLAQSAKKEEISPSGRILIGTIAGNVHQTGKILVGALLESEGFEVVDLGENVSRDDFISKTFDLVPDILVLACYTFNAQGELKNLLKDFEKSGLRSNLKIIIGGHSTSQVFAEQIGADAWAANPLDTVSVAKMLMNRK